MITPGHISVRIIMTVGAYLTMSGYVSVDKLAALLNCTVDEAVD